MLVTIEVAASPKGHVLFSATSQAISLGHGQPIVLDPSTSFCTIRSAAVHFLPRVCLVSYIIRQLVWIRALAAHGPTPLFGELFIITPTRDLASA